jgi:hypothetical protein
MLRLFILLLTIAALPRWASAIILSRYSQSNPTAQYNVTAPADDPGWYNVSDNTSAPSSSYVYLGNQWVLTAYHANGSNPPGPLQLANGVFPLIPGSDYRLTNPTGDYHQRNLSGGQYVNFFGPLTSHSDLRMFRVNTDVTTGLRPEDLNPGIKPISIATTAPGVGANLVMMGIGNDRGVNTSDVLQQGLFHFDVNTSSNPWTWPAPTNSGGDHFGFNVISDSVAPRVKRWGTNAVSPDTQLEQDWGVSDSNNLIASTINNNADVLTLIAKFDQLGPNSDEALASAGDSGGAVFFKDGTGQWKLAGVMHVIYLLSGQSAGKAIYGDWTAFSDLSNPHYYQQIEDRRALSTYSVMGDINLDGIVAGTGTGAWASDDVTAFVQGWLYERSQGDILTWKNGDLNQDGITDLSDFALLRTALGGTVSTADLQQLLGSAGGAGAVPEPGAIVLWLGILSGLLWIFRPRRRWAPARVARRS